MMDWYSHQYHRGIARYAKDAQWTLDASTIHSGRGFIHEHIDGIIGLFTRHSPVLEQARKLKLPLVDLCRALPEIPIPRVLGDNEGMGAEAAIHLLSRGFRHFAFVCRNATDCTVTERLRGFRRHLKQRGFNCSYFASSPVQLDPATRIDYLPNMVTWLKTRPTPLAILAQNDDIAIDLLYACETADLDVPLKVAIVGCDNDELICDFARIPLSSVDSNMEGQAYEGAHLLDRLMSGESPPRKPIRVPHLDVHIRQSSDVLAINHPELTAALRIIWSDYANPTMSVEHIAEQVKLSRQGLDIACKNHLGRTISDELKRIRLEHAIRMLQKSTAKISAIAQACGYTRVKHLRDTILRETGLTPLEYRRQNALKK